jgi:hypothetical protein
MDRWRWRRSIDRLLLASTASYQHKARKRCTPNQPYSLHYFFSI